MKKCLLILIIIMSTVLVACGVDVGKGENMHIKYLGYGLYRIIDLEAGVVCYEGDGTFCFLIEETRLDY